ncbi:hypothetical protein [Aliarcobacter cibarius]|uniref:Uncharacterized protein n=1 Tax=Aliarcobacter cibarius TaxID=255507 RepID=A0A7L5JQD8_9BACT|nr:hypothetical protein [Aliarcobacter cibarius]QKJ27339.1 hypothetical protein ACBT_1433 [Aliarcobacter cibarius]TLT02926.1 hypothetical protein FE248_08590 [Aliarcobacter cibarius]
MLDLKPEIRDIILLDKKYKNKEEEIDNLIIKVYNLYTEITSFKHINFDTIDENRIHDLNYFLTKEQINSIHSLHSNNDDLVNIILGIFSIINDMQTVSLELEEYRSKNHILESIEHDIQNTDKQINTLKNELEKAKILDDENQILKIEYAIGLFEDFKIDKTDALAKYKGFLDLLVLYNSFSESEKEKSYKLNKEKSYEYNKKNSEFFTNNIDYFHSIFYILNGYLLNSKKIYKSSALKIFNHVNNNLKINKKPLTDKVSHLFARLGIDINLDYRKSHNVRKISIYHDYTIYDYSTNKKYTNLYISEFNLLNKLLHGVKKGLEETPLKFNKTELAKKNLYISNINNFQNMYHQLKYVIN